MSDTVSKEFLALGREVTKSGKPHAMTVRELLRHFGQERRGREVIRFINYKLRYLELDTDPCFDEVHIDGRVSIIPRPKRPRGRPPKTVGGNPASAQVSGSAIEYTPTPAAVALPPDDDTEPRQPFLRLGLLESANRSPHTVRGNDTLETAVTLLMMHDITHIPVMQSERVVEGIITWRSIGRTKAANRATVKAQDCMDAVPRIVALDAPLFDTVRIQPSRFSTSD